MKEDRRACISVLFWINRSAAWKSSRWLCCFNIPDEFVVGYGLWLWPEVSKPSVYRSGRGSKIERRKERLRKVWKAWYRRKPDDFCLRKEKNLLLGTTVSAVLLIAGWYLIVHVGDSRVYGLTEDVQQLTKTRLMCREKLMQEDWQRAGKTTSPEKCTVAVRWSAGENYSGMEVGSILSGNGIFNLLGWILQSIAGWRAWGKILQELLESRMGDGRKLERSYGTE